MKQILSPHNTQLKHLAKLAKSAKYRRESRQTVLEGAHLLDAPHLTVFPGIFLALVVLGFNFVGDGLRDRLDPRTERT